MLNDKEYYLRATTEFEEKKLDEELWAKVIALADGDEEKAKFEYIKKRATNLQSEEFVETKFVPVVKRFLSEYFNPKNLSIYDSSYVVFYVLAMLAIMFTFFPDRIRIEGWERNNQSEFVVFIPLIFFFGFLSLHGIAVTFGHIYKFFNKAAVLEDIKRKTMSVLLAIGSISSFIAILGYVIATINR